MIWIKLKEVAQLLLGKRLHNNKGAVQGAGGRKVHGENLSIYAADSLA